MGNNINGLLFRPPPTTPLHPSCRFWLTTAYGSRIPAVYFKRSGAFITLLYSHANAEDLGLMFGWLKCLSRRLNVNILAYDYTGYGEADGTIIYFYGISLILKVSYDVNCIHAY